MSPDEPIGVSEFIALLNQTFDFAYPVVAIVGELSNFRVSKNKWVYFDLKDETSSLKFFGMVYQLRQPLEDGMLIKVAASPSLHNQYGFSMQVRGIELVGEGSLKRAAELLQVKLSAEGLFDEDRKRSLVYPPSKIGLITSSQSAAYADFIKILNARWRGIEISLIDVQVQGEPAVQQIVEAIEYFNKHSKDVDSLVLIRGGGSPEDLAVFSSEQVTRAVANSVVPTLVAIGHEIDVSLAELAADKRASTPSNAAELLVPDRRTTVAQLAQSKNYLHTRSREIFELGREILGAKAQQLSSLTEAYLSLRINDIKARKELIEAYDPSSVLSRGYSIVRIHGKAISSSKKLKLNDILDIELAEGELSVAVEAINHGK